MTRLEEFEIEYEQRECDNDNPEHYAELAEEFETELENIVSTLRRNK